MANKKLSKASLLISSISLASTTYCLSIPFTWNLNKTIGWGNDIMDFYRLITIIFVLLSFILTTAAILSEKGNTINYIALFFNLAAFGLIIMTIFTMFSPL